MLPYTIQQIIEATGLSEEKIEAYVKGLNFSGNAEDRMSEVIEVLQIGTHFVTKDSLIYAKSIIAAMCGVKGDAHKEAVLERAITQGIEEFGGELEVSKLAEVLNNLKDVEIAHALAETLYPYTEKGIHGRFFKAGKSASFKEMLTVFEFEEVKNDEVLLGVVLQDKPPIGGSLAFYISCQLLLSKVICKSLQIIRVKDGNNR